MGSLCVGFGDFDSFIFDDSGVGGFGVGDSFVDISSFIFGD